MKDIIGRGFVVLSISKLIDLVKDNYFFVAKDKIQIISNKHPVKRFNGFKKVLNA